MLTFGDPARSDADLPEDAAARLGRTIRAVAAGAQDAFSAPYADYVRMVHAILLGRVPRPDVDDLVQDDPLPRSCLRSTKFIIAATRTPTGFPSFWPGLNTNCCIAATEFLSRP